MMMSARTLGVMALACLVVFMGTCPDPAVAAGARNRKMLQAPGAGGEEEDLTRERIIALLQDQAGVPHADAPAKATAAAEGEAEASPFANMFEEFSGFMHAYVDDLAARAVHMNFDIFKGVEDPWTENFKTFLDDESLHTMLEKGAAPPWIVAQKVNLDLWRNHAADGGATIQEVLMKELASADLQSILQNSDDPIVKALVAGSERNQKQLSAFTKMMGKWMKPPAGAGEGVGSLPGGLPGGLPGMDALGAPLGGEADLLKMFMSATASEKAP